MEYRLGLVIIAVDTFAIVIVAVAAIRIVLIFIVVCFIIMYQPSAVFAGNIMIVAAMGT